MALYDKLNVNFMVPFLFDWNSYFSLFSSNVAMHFNIPHTLQNIIHHVYLICENI